MRPKYSSPGAEFFNMPLTYCCHFEILGAGLAAVFFAVVGLEVALGDGVVTGAAATELAMVSPIAAAVTESVARFNDDPF